MSRRPPSEVHEIRPALAARRETPPTPPRLKAGGLAPRAAARHFAGVRASPGVRPFGPPPLQSRTVVVIARKILSAATARKALSTQLRYLEREGPGEGRTDRFFDADRDGAEAPAFRERSREDPGHYRIIVSPGDDCELPDIRDYGRRLMQRIEARQAAPLDWIAADHHDTGRPHLHILLRDRTLDGGRLALARSDLNGGLRQEAEALATELLGPRVERIGAPVIRSDRLTPIDCVLIEHAREGRIEAPALPAHYRPDALRRLGHLERRGWVRPLSPGVWEVPADLQRTLRQAGQDRAREIAAARAVRDGDWRDHRARLTPLSLAPGERLSGAFAGVHRLGPLPRGGRELVVDLLDGRLAHVMMRDVYSVMCLDRIREGAPVELIGARRSPRTVDQTIEAVAARADGVWSAEAHARVRPGDWPRYIGFHQRRLEALSREGACADLGEGRFAIPPDYGRRALESDVALWGPADHRVRVLDHRLLDEQVEAPGLTWLDRLMTTSERPPLAGPFGEATGQALSRREAQLRLRDLGSGDPLVLAEDAIRELKILEVKSVFEALEADGKAVFLLKEGQSARGVYVQKVHVSGFAYGVLEGRAAIHLTPWTPGMEACRGKTLDAVINGGLPQFRTVRGAGLELGAG